MMRIVPLAALALVASCASIPEAGAGRCDATRVQNFIGALGTADLGQLLLKRSGARTLRWLAPDTAATRDYRLDRLNVRVDKRNFVTALDCG